MVSNNNNIMVLLQPIRELQQQQIKLMKAVDDNHRAITSVLEELKGLVQEQINKNFQIKGSPIEVIYLHQIFDYNFMNFYIALFYYMHR